MMKGQTCCKSLQIMSGLVSEVALKGKLRHHFHVVIGLLPRVLRLG